MFIDKNSNSQFTPAKPAGDSLLNKPWFKYLGLGLILLAVIIIIVIVVLVIKQKNQHTTGSEKPTDNTTSLPGGHLDSTDNVGDQTTEAKVKAESLFFGDFYQPITEAVDTVKTDSALPLNIKKDVANYYPLTREINLDDVVTKINEQGFAVIDNPYNKTAKDFFAVYAELNKRNLAFLITSDFMIYYYQNYLKQIYKGIESQTFFKAFWDLNKEMYVQADKRYRDRLAKVGVLNDPILEGLRLEAVYFAMNLELLKPTAKQIVPASKESVKSTNDLSNDFTTLEGEYYSFTAPDYLNPTIKQELEIISKAGRYKEPVKSPALLYKRDYNVFDTPKEYYYNNKLKNFYLAVQWSQSLFPLYFRSEDCPNCYLDQEDWLINQTAAHLIARDLSANQNWKNNWAKVYKTMSFFGNLRSELTYLDYDKAFRELFPDKAIEDVLDATNSHRVTDLVSISNKIADNDFDPAKGGLDRQTASGKQESGMRILQTSHDPAKFVYDKLLYNQAGLFINYNRLKVYPGLNTLCEDDFSKGSRCRGIGLDIINPLFNEVINSSYFNINTNYKNYANQTALLRAHYADFKDRDWHENNYWSTLDISRKYLNNRKQEAFPHTLNAYWANEVLNTSAAANLNSYLPLDKWTLSLKKNVVISSDKNIITYHYVEPNLPLINELNQNAKMVFNVFVGLDLIKENNNEFGELMSDLENLRQMVIKEYRGEDFSYKEWTFINEIINRYYVEDYGAKTKQITFSNPNNPNRSKKTEQSISDLKLMVEVHRREGKDVLYVGPIFNYWEEKK